MRTDVTVMNCCLVAVITASSTGLPPSSFKKNFSVVSISLIAPAQSQFSRRAEYTMIQFRTPPYMQQAIEKSFEEGMMEAEKLHSGINFGGLATEASTSKMPISLRSANLFSN